MWRIRAEHEDGLTYLLAIEYALFEDAHLVALEMCDEFDDVHYWVEEA